jgi:hypothetical protein
MKTFIRGWFTGALCGLFLILGIAIERHRESKKIYVVNHPYTNHWQQPVSFPIYTNYWSNRICINVTNIDLTPENHLYDIGPWKVKNQDLEAAGIK